MLRNLLIVLALLAQEEDRIVAEGVVDAPVADVWAALTTKAGLESWMVPHAEIDLKVGGLMRTLYDPKGKLGDPKTIENTILSFDPRRMISLKATKPPEGFPFPEAIKSMWTVVYFDPAEEGRTRVRIVGLGFGSDEESKKLKAFFQQGNQATLDRLRRHLAKKK